MKLIVDMHQELILKKDEKLPVQTRFPALRRSNPLQILVTELLDQADIWLKKADPSEFPAAEGVYGFASAGGDMSANAIVAQGLLENDLPVSPLAFQASVPNTTPALWTILNKRQNHFLTVSSGSSSRVDLLDVLAVRLLSGCYSWAVLVAAEEENPKMGLCASGEVMIFRLPSSHAQRPTCQASLLTYRLNGDEDVVGESAVRSLPLKSHACTKIPRPGGGVWTCLWSPLT